MDGADGSLEHRGTRLIESDATDSNGIRVQLVEFSDGTRGYAVVRPWRARVLACAFWRCPPPCFPNDRRRLTHLVICTSS